LTENFSAVWKQYVGLLSPSVLMFQTGPPKRYSVPTGGSMTSFEYLGVILALAFLFLGKNFTNSQVGSASELATTQANLKPLVTLVLSFVLIAAVPSALTQDDFPNLQRAVIMLPWLQLASALGWFVTLKTFIDQFQSTTLFRKWLTLPLMIVGIILLLSASSLISFWYGYVAQTPFERPLIEVGLEKELAKWINANAHDAKIIQEHVEGVFFYPYLFAQEDFKNFTYQKNPANIFDSA
jgi:hypothetical protein